MKIDSNTPSSKNNNETNYPVVVKLEANTENRDKRVIRNIFTGISLGLIITIPFGILIGVSDNIFETHYHPTTVQR